MTESRNDQQEVPDPIRQEKLLFAPGHGIDFLHESRIRLLSADKLGDWVAGDDIHLVLREGRNCRSRNAGHSVCSENLE